MRMVFDFFNPYPIECPTCPLGWSPPSPPPLCQETSSFTIVHLLYRIAHVQLHGAMQCTLDRGLGPKDSCQRKTIRRRAQTNDKQTAAESYMVAEQGSW